MTLTASGRGQAGAGAFEWGRIGRAAVLPQPV